ncbi:MAG: family 43 glycosylhydrolase [Bacteroidales bacterium]|nr:family 43 glycosylhydrolase [Bacteroidales bacterium]
MKRYFIAALLPFILISSCRKEQEPCTVIKASFTEEVRTTLAFPKLHWSAGDVIVVNGQSSTGIEIHSEGEHASFTLPPVQPPYRALYPASACSGLNLVLPEEQVYVEDSFDPSAALMYGWSESTPDLGFSCGTAFLKVTVQGNSDTHAIRRIELASAGSEGLSGSFSFNTSTHRLDNHCAAGTKVIVRSPEGIPQGRPIYAAIAPGTYPSGLNIRIVDVHGHYRDLRSDNSFTASAGVIYATTVPFEPSGTIIDGTTSDSNLPGAVTAVTKEGTMVRSSVADPCMYYLDGKFYLTMTGTSNIGMVSDPSPNALTTAAHPMNASLYVYQSSKDPNVAAMFGDGAEINGTWSPEIHYFSEQDFPGEGGWYMFLALRKKYIVDNIAMSTFLRMVVLKSTSGKIQGPYGHPVDGTANKSQSLLDASGAEYTEWGCGQSILRIPTGQYAGIYALWVAETGRGEGLGNFYQKIMISRMSSPWQLSGEPGIVTTPTQPWEKKGASELLPQVVEGATAVYGKHGEIFLAYCGSGYWSDYGLGQLTLKRTGTDYMNPLLTSSWVKYDNNPIFSSRQSEDMRGAGHAFFLKDEKDSLFMCYHAYPFDGEKRGSARNAYMEPCSIDYGYTSATAPQGLLSFGLPGNGIAAPSSSSFTFYVRQ